MSDKLKRNVKIEYTRFVGSIVILLFHARFDEDIAVFQSGWIMVEYFFMLTGYLTVKHIEYAGINTENKIKYCILYDLKKMRSMLFYIVTGDLLCYIIYFFVNGYDRKNAIGYMIAHFPIEVMQLLMTGSGTTGEVPLNYPLWYVSVIFLILPVVMYLYIKYTEIIKYYVQWSVPLFIYGYFNYNYGTIGVWWENNGILRMGILRGIAGLFLGGLVFSIAESIKRIKNMQIRYILQVIRVISFILILFIAQFNVYVNIVPVYFMIINLSVSFGENDLEKMIQERDSKKGLGGGQRGAVFKSWNVFRKA